MACPHWQGQFILLMIWDLQRGQMNLLSSLLETCGSTCCLPAEHLVICAYRFVRPGEHILCVDTSLQNTNQG